jgi:hypothetical protein
VARAKTFLIRDSRASALCGNLPMATVRSSRLQALADADGLGRLWLGFPRRHDHLRNFFLPTLFDRSALHGTAGRANLTKMRKASQVIAALRNTSPRRGGG